MNELVLNISKLPGSLKSKDEKIVDYYYQSDDKQKAERLLQLKIRINGYSNPTLSEEENDLIKENLLKIEFGLQTKNGSTTVELNNLITAQGLERLRLLLGEYKIPNAKNTTNFQFDCFITNVSEIVNLRKKKYDNTDVKKFTVLKKNMFFGDRDYLISVGNNEGVLLHLFTDIYIPIGMLALVEINSKAILDKLPGEIRECISTDGALGLYVFIDKLGFGYLKKLLLYNIKKYPTKTIMTKIQIVPNCYYFYANDCKGWRRDLWSFTGICGSCLKF